MPLDPVSRQTFARPIADLCQEFAGVFSPETVERYIDESIDHMSGARIADFIPLFVHRFARQRLRALAQAEGLVAKDVPEVLFVCTHNAGRSQMAAALLDHHAEGRVHVRSAGSQPADQLNPAVVAAMEEIGLDLSGSSRSRSPTRSSEPPTPSSPWAAVSPARSTRASATRTGSWTTRPASRSRRSA